MEEISKILGDRGGEGKEITDIKNGGRGRREILKSTSRRKTKTQGGGEEKGKDKIVTMTCVDLTVLPNQ